METTNIIPGLLYTSKHKDEFLDIFEQLKDEFIKNDDSSIKKMKPINEETFYDNGVNRTILIHSEKYIYFTFNYDGWHEVCSVPINPSDTAFQIHMYYEK